MINSNSAAFLAAFVVALLTAAAIGCGGSSEAAPLKKAEFVNQANAICVTAQAEREGQRQELAESADESGGPGEAEAVMALLLEPIDQMTEELGDLGPPKGQEKEVAAIVAAYEEGASKLEADPSGVDSSAAFDKANELAQEYGLKACTI